MLLRAARAESAKWAVLSIALFALFSITESSIFTQNEITWVLYAATTAKLFRWGRHPADA